MSEYRNGDVVLVRGVIVKDYYPCVRLGYEEIPVGQLAIIKIETPNFQVGDGVIAQGISGEVLCVWPDGELLWVKPHGGNGVPWTIHVSECQRSDKAKTEDDLAEAPSPPPEFTEAAA